MTITNASAQRGEATTNSPMARHLALCHGENSNSYGSSRGLRFMPLYAYVCECGKSEDRFNRIADRHTNAPECHGPMILELQPNYGYVQGECHYRSPLNGQPITSWRQRKYEMESKGYVDANDFKPETAFKREEGELARRTSLANKLTGPLTRKDLEPHVPVI